MRSEFWFSIKSRPGFSESGSARLGLLYVHRYMMEKKLLEWFQLTKTWRERRREMLSSIRSSTGGEWVTTHSLPARVFCEQGYHNYQHVGSFFCLQCCGSKTIHFGSGSSVLVWIHIRTGTGTTELRIQIWIRILHFLHWLSRGLKYLGFFPLIFLLISNR